MEEGECGQVIAVIGFYANFYIFAGVNSEAYTMLNTYSNGSADSFKIAVFLFKWRKTLLFIGLSAAVISAIVSSPLIITPLYKSTLIMYPATGNSVSKSLIAETDNQREDLLEYGSDEQTEQLMQILNSNRIRDKVINKFNLSEHYGISPGSRYYHSTLYYRYNCNISFRRTDFMAVKVDAKGFLKVHEQFHEIDAVGAQIGEKARPVADRRRIDLQMLGDDGPRLGRQFVASHD